MADDTARTAPDTPNVRLNAALERETALREILSVIRDSRADEQPVFDAILHHARRLCDSPMAGLVMGRKGDRAQRLAASYGTKTSTVALFASGAVPLEPSKSFVAQAVFDGRMIHVPDLADTDKYRNGAPNIVSMVEEEGIRTALFVPLMAKDGGIGCFVLYRHEIRPYAETQIELVKTFADQAVIAIENVHQYRDVQQRLEREAATREILQVISQSRGDETPVFDVILRKAADLCRAPHAALNLVDGNREFLEYTVSYGPDLTFSKPGVTKWPLQPDSLIARTILEKRALRIDDLADSDEYRSGDPGRVAHVNEDGIRSYMAVPLIINDTAIGNIGLFRREVDPFSQDDLELIQTFADQAVIAIENVRQFREVQQRLEREAATREVLEVISQSRADEQPVLDTIVRNAARLCDATLVGLSLVNETRTALAYKAVCGAQYEAFYAGFEFDLDGPLQVAVTVRESRIIHTRDLAEDPVYLARDPVRVKMVEEVGVRTFLTVPLVKDGVALGCLNLNRNEVKPFTADEIALIETFAEQAVIAIENVRQFVEIQQRLEREKATRQVLQVISQSRDDDAPVFEEILGQAARLCHAQTAGLQLVNEAGSHAQLICNWGASGGVFNPGFEMDMTGTNLVVQAIREARVISVADLKDTDLYRQGWKLRRQLVDEEGVRSWLIVPLLRDGVGFGSMSLSRKEVKPFAADEIALIETFAEQAVIAIDNVRQFKALESRTAEVEALNTGLEERVATQVDQLERMGRLKRFLSPQVADAVISSGDNALLGSHRALIATLFCDIRGFTAFCERAEPEETIEVLQTYHEAMGQLIADHGAGVDHRAGDGIMVIFNDPLPCDDPTGDALRMAFAMRDRMAELAQGWRRMGHKLGFGVGISLGYATVGMVGSEGRYDYTASGTAVNLAARLCDHASDGEILLSPRACLAVEEIAQTEPAGEMEFKGIHAPTDVFRAVALKG